MKLASRKISIPPVLIPFVVFGLAVLLVPVGVFAQTTPLQVTIAPSQRKIPTVRH